jgi:hypothetical protein
LLADLLNDLEGAWYIARECLRGTDAMAEVERRSTHEGGVLEVILGRWDMSECLDQREYIGRSDDISP